jgi:hypothetical protein
VGIAEVVHRLPEQGDFDHASIDQALALVDDRVGPSPSRAHRRW